MNRSEIDEIVERHEEWLNSDGGGRADLWGADLREADLREADLREADLWNADLREADLWEVDLWEADLREADLWNADLREADLWEVDLWDGDNTGLYINWISRNLISEILRQEAGDSRPKREVAGLIALSHDWCFEDWKKQVDNIRNYLVDWVYETLQKRSKNEMPDEFKDIFE